MTLLNPLMLAGLLVTGIPLIIHLLNRSRFRVEPFGAFMFLQKAVRVRASRLKLRNKMLLTMRCLLLALIVLALSRPVFAPQTASSEHQPTTHIIIMDSSFSMGFQGNTQSPFDKARREIMKILERLRPDDNLQLIWGCNQPQPLFERPIYETQHAQREVRQLEPCTGTFDLPQALRQAFWTADASRLPRQQIYLFTDGQAHGWQARNQNIWQKLGEQQSMLRTAPRVYTLIQPPPDTTPNLAITAFRPAYAIRHIYRPADFRVELYNGGTSTQKTTLEFSVDDTIQSTRPLTLAPGTTSIQLPYHFRKPGHHFAEVRLTPSDSLPVDDTRGLALTVYDGLRVLVIGGTAAENLWLDDASLAVRALEAQSSATSRGLFQTKVKSASFMDAVRPEVLDDYDAIILSDLESFSDYSVFALERFIQRGGGLLVAAGSKASAATYRFLFKDGTGLLPAKLQTPQTYQDRFSRLVLTPRDNNNVYETMGIERQRELNGAVVTKYWKCSPAPRSTVLATVNEAPFLIEAGYGKGRVILWTTSLNATWTNLPATPHYLPLLHTLITALASGRRSQLNLAVQEPIVIEQSSPATNESEPENTPPRIILPDGREAAFPQPDKAGAPWKWTDTAAPGIYRIHQPHQNNYSMAVRPPAEESDLQALSDDAKKMIASFFDMKIYEDTTSFQAGTQQQSEDVQLWQWIIGVALVMLGAESYMSWRFSRA